MCMRARTHIHTHTHTHTHQMASDVAARAQATSATKKQSSKAKLATQKCAKAKSAAPVAKVPPALRSHSSEVAKSLNLKRADYPPDIVKLVMGLRAASYNIGGTDLAHLFKELDIDHSGTLDSDEFKRALRRFVCHACHRVVSC